MRSNSVGKFSRIAAISILCFCGGSQAQQPPQPQTATSPEKGGATRAAGSVTKSVSESGSSLTVACESPIELLVTDPQGRKTGGDPTAHRSYDEIPGAYYESAGIEDAETGAAESNPAKTLFIANPIPGSYGLSVVGIDVGTYTCKLLSDDVAGGHSETGVANIPILRGEIQKFVFEFDGKPGTHLRLSGGFTESAESVAKEIRLFSYATPMTTSIHASSGRREVPFLIFYDPGIVPSTFSAELNGKTVTALFHPKPGGWELIEIPLAERLNRVQLMVSGNSARAATNTVDRFEISVE